MTVKIYKIADDPRKITKNLVDSGAGSNLIGSYTVTMKQGGDVMNAHFTVSDDVHDANYVYIADYGRYYFINDVKVSPTGVYEVSCHVDVLMSYAAQLKSLTVTLDRSETIFNGYLQDSEYDAKQYRAVAMKVFPSGLYDDNYILITTG